MLNKTERFIDSEDGIVWAPHFVGLLETASIRDSEWCLICIAIYDELKLDKIVLNIEEY